MNLLCVAAFFAAMRKTIAILLAAFLSVPVFAQDFRKIFDDFQRSAETQMRNFQESTREEFMQTLARQWQQFNAQEPEKRPVKPKPETAPEAPAPSPLQLPDISLDPVEEEVVDIPEFDPLSSDSPKVSPFEMPRPDANILIDMGGRNNYFSFYSMPVGMSTLTSLQGGRKPRLSSIEEKQVAKFWAALETSSNGSASFASEVLPALDRCRRTFDLNDWTLYRLVVSFVASQWDKESEQALVQVFILNHLGIDARLCRLDNHLSLMFPAQQIVYARPYIVIGGKNFYIMDDSSATSVYTYSERFSEQVTDMELALVHADRIFDILEPKVVEKELSILQMTLKVPYHQARCDFYMDFPQLSVEQYARTKVDETFSTALLKQLSFVRRIPDVDKAVLVIMRCIQVDFDYANDQEQFGIEKPFFLEENFEYPKNDCEDRSILMTYLVRELLGLDIVLLDYPEHIATAVYFGNVDVPGDFIMHNGKKYVICDPTYIGAGVGMEMPMFKDITPEVLEY